MIIQTNNKPKIVRQGYLAEKIVIVDGLPGCGKTLFSPIIGTMDRVELLCYAFEVEFICRLFHFQKIEEDAAIAMVRMLTDHKLYQTMMGRDTNFRYSDISSVFYDSNPWRYFKRIFQDGDKIIPEKIKQERPILHLTTHDLLSMSEPIFDGLGDRLIFIEVVRHPLYMLIQQTLNVERLLSDPRDIQIYFQYQESQLPYFTHKWENLFLSSNAVEKSIYSMEKSLDLTEKKKVELINKYGNQLLTIPFEKFALNPSPFIENIATMLETHITPSTKKMMKKQNVPRKNISDSISLPAYKHAGWAPAEKLLSEKQELNKRREYAISKGASKKAMNILDKISRKYEQKNWSP